MEAQKLAQIYNDAVQKLGYQPKIDDDMDVIFKHPDIGTFFISLDAVNDPEFMRIVLPNFVDERLTGGDKDKLVALLNTVNHMNKAVKLSAREGKDGAMNVSAAAEFFVAGQDQAPTSEHIDAILRRTISAIKAGVENLVRQARQARDEESM